MTRTARLAHGDYLSLDDLIGVGGELLCELADIFGAFLAGESRPCYSDFQLPAERFIKLRIYAPGKAA